MSDIDDKALRRRIANRKYQEKLKLRKIEEEKALEKLRKQEEKLKKQEKEEPKQENKQDVVYIPEDSVYIERDKLEELLRIYKEHLTKEEKVTQPTKTDENFFLRELKRNTLSTITGILPIALMNVMIALVGRHYSPSTGQSLKKNVEVKENEHTNTYTPSF